MNIEIEDDVKRLTITGQDEHAQVVMRQELRDEDLDSVAGGGKPPLKTAKQPNVKRTP